MIIRFVSSLLFIELPLANYVKAIDEVIEISNLKTVIDHNYFTKHFIESIGSIGAKKLRETPFIHCNGTLEFYNETFGETDYGTLLELVSGIVQNFLLCLWLVKDNSVNINMSYFYIQEKELVITNKRYLLFSNSQGQYENTFFSNEDIENASEMFAIMSDSITNVNSKNIQTKANNVTIANKIDIRYNSFDRFTRSIYFVTIARSQSFLPSKITFYMNFLESIFTTDNTEISHKVSERVSKFIGGNFDNVKDNYKLIKDAYGIRSKYSHGQKYKKDNEISLLSTNIDYLIRKIIIKVLTPEYYDVFFVFNNSQLEEWFTNLILK